MSRRNPNGSGYIRRKELPVAGVRYEARLRNRWLGQYETRKEAQNAIDAQNALHRAQNESVEYAQ